MRLDRELMRGVGPTAVLKLLANGPMYGYELITALAERTDGVLDMGQATLYPMLYNIEARGEIESFKRDGENGRERKYYRLTDAGKKRLAADSEQLRHMVRAMAMLSVIRHADVKGAVA